MLNLLQSFLSERTFQVSIGGHTSQEYLLENGVPQGSVLSVTLFLIAMQPIFRVLPAGVEILLYADDILLVVRRAKEEGLHRRLQTAVKAVNKWAKSVGFSISATKSQTFYCSPNARREPAKEITIEQIPVPKTNLLRILGVTLDRTLTFKPHCKAVKKSCDSRLRILQIIGAKLPRGNRATLLQVGSALVTAKLMYGIGLVSRGGPETLQTLAPAYNKMVRYASGAFVTSPINSIMAEAGTLPFGLLVTQSVARTAIRIMTKCSNNSTLPLIRRASDRLGEITGTTLPAIDQLARQSDRVWHARRPSIVWDVKNCVRAGAPPNRAIPVVQELLSTRFRSSTVIYTDGSKSDDTVGAAFHTTGLAGSFSLPQACSVFSAEAYAIKKAVLTPNTDGEIIILTDSASCLLALESGTSKHPWIQEIENLVHNKLIRFCWIPGHAGISGNTEADRLANEARRQPAIDMPIPGEDALRAMKQAIRWRWNRQWHDSRDEKLREIKNDTLRWMDQSSPADQRALTRLRIGHTRLTHTFLLKKDPPPTCECCGTIVDVRHIILHCQKYKQQRQDNDINTTSLRAALGNADEATKRLLLFLQQTNLSKQL
ncbi:uncharacterized protein LOC134206306 [Armigeres subalbatus]|uniref:uncharacterized protein LOC134206306 n=1 Tax=Armigeres subalbatus TaxID=124917 RepID=UPI002ED14E9A